MNIWKFLFCWSCIWACILGGLYSYFYLNHLQWVKQGELVNATVVDIELIGGLPAGQKPDYSNYNVVLEYHYRGKRYENRELVFSDTSRLSRTKFRKNALVQIYVNKEHPDAVYYPNPSKLDLTKYLLGFGLIAGLPLTCVLFIYILSFIILVFKKLFSR